jgi:hypothetical protein
MVDYRDFLDVSAGQIDEAAERWEQAHQALLARCEDLDAKVKGLDSWEGGAADSAKSTFANYRKQLSESAESFAHIAPLRRAAGRKSVPPTDCWSSRLTTHVMRASKSTLILAK